MLLDLFDIVFDILNVASSLLDLFLLDIAEIFEDNLNVCFFDVSHFSSLAHRRSPGKIAIKYELYPLTLSQVVLPYLCKGKEMTMTAQELLEKAAECEAKAAASFERCDTDGFVSQHCHQLTARECRAKAKLAENGGKATFLGLFVRETGERVAAKLINGRFGLCWAFCDEEGTFTGRFLSHSKGTKRSKMFREGFEVREEEAPAKVVMRGEGTGLSGLATVRVETVRADGGFPAEAVVL